MSELSGRGGGVLALVGVANGLGVGADDEAAAPKVNGVEACAPVPENENGADLAAAEPAPNEKSDDASFFVGVSGALKVNPVDAGAGTAGTGLGGDDDPAENENSVEGAEPVAGDGLLPAPNEKGVGAFGASAGLGSAKAKETDGLTSADWVKGAIAGDGSVGFEKENGDGDGADERPSATTLVAGTSGCLTSAVVVALVVPKENGFGVVSAGADGVVSGAPNVKNDLEGALAPKDRASGFSGALVAGVVVTNEKGREPTGASDGVEAAGASTLG